MEWFGLDWIEEEMRNILAFYLRVVCLEKLKGLEKLESGVRVFVCLLA